MAQTSRSSRALASYRAKRNFGVTSEPSGEESAAARDVGGAKFVIQKHWARRLHYDFRLQIDGTLKSWAVPKGPSLDPADKRLAVQVEDHPLSYASFEGTIPENQYGAGRVVIWDEGRWIPEGDPARDYAAGHLKFTLHGRRLHGRWALIRIKGREARATKTNWLLIKERDDARPKIPPPQRSSPGAPAAHPLPQSFRPELATLVGSVPSDVENWIFEVKFDGYRILVRVDGDELSLLTRNGHDWTSKLIGLKRALLALRLPTGWYDGELVVLDRRGISDFDALQASFESGASDDTVLFLFDLPYLEGRDLRELPLEDRRALLRETLAARPRSKRVRFSEAIVGTPAAALDAACRKGLEGLIAKRRDSTYVQRRSADWIKLKCTQRQEFVIGGYTDPEGARKGFGALLLGVFATDGKLQYVGNVGTGFSETVLQTLYKELNRLATPKAPFSDVTAVPGRPHWARPKLVAEVSFAGWTRAGRLRQAVFHGLRLDKEPRTVKRERARAAVPQPGPIEKDATRFATESPARMRVTHGERVIDPGSGVTKLDLVGYYAQVGKLMMPHLSGRPISLLRAPEGIAGPHFFQKHFDVEKLPGMGTLDPDLSPGHPPWLTVKTPRGILSAAQWNVVEFHTLNGIADKYDHPDRMIFDLDPGEGVNWNAIREAAELLHGFIEELSLRAFLKTSGGKGLHVVVPIRTAESWESVKAFSRGVVGHVAKVLPDRFVAKSGPSNRVGKIFIDYLRNGRESSTVSAWSARARPGLGVSVPLAWDELGSVKSGDQWTLRNVQERLRVGNAAWADYQRGRRDLEPAMRILGGAPRATSSARAARVRAAPIKRAPRARRSRS